ncbi:phosphoenolpyruvate--protein phosphotransferase [Paenibacillus solisilvae]|uniref:Phosphoenolpyruvate-protein phosphotransferase n=1 Tax=Paenibacillus solisilvae TaxID=2486751 RepID=A0ABW0VYW9_9BACL
MNLNGIGAAKGLAVGPAVVIRELPPVKRNSISLGEVPAEKDRLTKAMERAGSELEELKNRLSPELQGIIKAQLLFMKDPDLMSSIEACLEDGKNAEWAVEEAADEFIEAISMLSNDYLKERAGDVKDFQRRVLAALMGLPAPSIDLTRPSILIAKDLTPSDTAALDVSMVLGFATEAGGPTSHSAIIARSAGFPAIVGVADLLNVIKDGDTVVLEAFSGEVLVNPPDDIKASYTAKMEDNRRQLLESKRNKDLPAVTLDGREVELAANIGSPHDAALALEWGAASIGLFRTEFLYMQSNELPSEETQYAAYKKAVETMLPRSVIFRTLDIGGDKALPYLQMPPEENPFLGYRALRLCLDRPDLFKTQLRAILRAGEHGNIRIMFPMVATIDELRRAKEMLREAANELGLASLPEIGIMVEIPSTAIMARTFAEEVDFFSIGSNDLIQYTVAADRGNKSVSYLYQYLEPSVLHLIANVIEAAHAAGKWAGMCGEMAGDPQAIPFLLGLGLDEFSMNAPALPEARDLIRSLSLVECRKLAERALKCRSVEEIQALIAD